MDLSALFKRAGQVAADNSPAILTAIGVTGTLSTAYLAAKAAFKSVDVLKKAEEAKKEEFLGSALQEVAEGQEPVGVSTISPEPLTTQEQIEAVWSFYVPAVVSGALTITAIICSNRISDRRAAAMASAYSIVEKSYQEYRQKTAAKVGKKKEQDIRAEAAQDRVDAHPASRTTLIITGRGETLCYDTWSDRWFNNDLEAMRKAVNDFNARVINETYASLSDFYELIGISSTRESDTVGWCTDKLLEVSFDGIIDEHGQPGIALDFKVLPNARFSSLY